MKISKIETEMADVKKRAVAQMTAMLVLASSLCVAGIGFETNEAYELAAQLYDSYEKSCEYSSGEKYRRRDTACGFLTAKGMFFELEESWMYVTVLQTMNDLR